MWPNIQNRHKPIIGTNERVVTFMDTGSTGEEKWPFSKEIRAPISSRTPPSCDTILSCKRTRFTPRPVPLMAKLLGDHFDQFTSFPPFTTRCHIRTEQLDSERRTEAQIWTLIDIWPRANYFPPLSALHRVDPVRSREVCSWQSTLSFLSSLLPRIASSFSRLLYLTQKKFLSHSKCIEFTSNHLFTAV